ncbi:hypothetical protein [Marinobacter sp. LQ44]|uniref:hypothetical protein n=1 Tax=Marinobacter sp. LQ44 TaxID=1749259 RepID=UPI001D0D2581|nr:hypothetical protein [Marinobacter sp. LQ44]
MSKQTLGVNYYANKNVRLGMSYMDGEEAMALAEMKCVRGYNMHFDRMEVA